MRECQRRKVTVTLFGPEVVKQKGMTDYRPNRLPIQASATIVNVASVPQRSPFRYAGGKTWLVPRIRAWLMSRPMMPSLLLEPFAGGGIVSLTAVFEALVQRALLVELDEGVGAVWQTLLNGKAEWLADAVERFHVTDDEVHSLLSEPHPALEWRALQTIVRNRVNRGGVMAPGAGLVKHGENGHGLRSRWYPATLGRRIREIAAHADRLTFRHGDGLEALEQHADVPDAVSFIDPPYPVAGRRLYVHNTVDHSRLFAIASRLDGDFLMTYDDSPEILSLARSYGFDVRLVPMKTTHHDEKLELLIGRDLAWMHGQHARRLGELVA